jgi:plastocyanin
MRRSVFIAGLTAARREWAFGTGRKGSVTRARRTRRAMEVKIDNFGFGPVTLTLPVGTAVTWTKCDDIPHTILSTDDPRALKAKVLDTDEEFSFTFSKSATYQYFCSIHPKMTGKSSCSE